MLLVQDVAYAITDQNEVITLVAEESREELEVTAYQLKGILGAIEKIGANSQLQITIGEKDFARIPQRYKQ